VRVWDLRTGAPVGEPLVAHAYGVSAVVVGELADQPVIISSGGDKTVKVWDFQTRSPLLTISMDAAITALALSGDHLVVIHQSRLSVILV